MPQLFRLMRFLSAFRLFTAVVNSLFQHAHLRKTFLLYIFEEPFWLGTFGRFGKVLNQYLLV